jgi:hypothetical protein
VIPIFFGNLLVSSADFGRLQPLSVLPRLLSIPEAPRLRTAIISVASMPQCGPATPTETAPAATMVWIGTLSEME